MRSETDAILGEAIHLLQLGWCQEHMAEDADGEWADPEGDDAVAWCATGAIMAAMHHLGLEDDLDERRYLRAVRRVAQAAVCEDDDWEVRVDAAVMGWNDNQPTAEDVILVFKQALAL